MDDFLNVSALTDAELYQKQTILNQRYNIASQMFSGDLANNLMSYLRIIENEIQIRSDKVFAEHVNKSTPSVVNTDEVRMTKDALKNNKKTVTQRRHNIIRTKHPVYDDRSKTSDT